MEVLSCVLAAVQTAEGLASLMQTLLNEINKNSGNATRESAEETVTELESWLSTFQGFLRDKQRDKGRSRVTQGFVNKVRDFTYDIEDAFDEFMFSVPDHLHTTKIGRTAHEVIHSRTYKSAFDKLSSCRDKIKKELGSQSDVMNQLRKNSGPLGEDSPRTSSSSQETLTHNIVEEDGIVIMKRRRDGLVNQLISTNVVERATILVVGPGGSGKTFLVKNVFRDKQVRDKFDCHAWVHVSPSCKVEILLLDMFKQFCNDQISLDQGVDIHEKLHRYMKGKRYLVVLDDVWSKKVYIPFANALPNHFIGSRIIVTSRNNVAPGAYMSNYIHRLDGLNLDEAWHLFCWKAFRNRQGDCPPELISSSKKIIARCDGFPLAIAAVGNLLSNKQKVKTEWDKFYERLDFEIGPDSDLPVIGRIVQPSFEDLPDDLKNCFLYMSLFPKGYSIKRGRLIRSWIAQGFVKLEQVAEAHMNILIDKNLVQVSEWEIDGRVRSCRVRNLFHELLVSMSRKVSFLTLPQPNNSGSSCEKARHLSVHNLATNLTHIANPGQLRTFFMFGQPDASSSSSSGGFLKEKILRTTPSDSLESISKKFKLLKVLDMQGTPLKDFSKDIGRLVLLRCINLSHTQVKFVPKSVKKLVFLETLNLKHTLVTNLPKGIYKLRRLRHLLVSHYDMDAEQQGVEVSERIASLTCLQELSLVKVNNETATIKNMGKLKELRKLRLVGLNRKLGKKLCDSIQKMKSLSTLDVRAETEEEFLYLDYDMGDQPPQIHRLYLKGRLESLPRCIPKLQSLVKVGLNGSKLNANVNPVEAFEALPSLMELKMVEYYTGEELVFRAGKFMSLKILHIKKFADLSKVVMENNVMPKLEKITIQECNNLKSVAPGTFDRKQLVEFLQRHMNEEFISNPEREKKSQQF